MAAAKSRLVGAAVFLQTLRNYRFLWLGGRFGGGKTSLAVFLSYFILRMGWADFVVSNIPIAWGVPPVLYRRYTPDDAVLLLDEGGLFMKFSGDFERVGAFMRKLNMYALLPSVIPPAGIFRMFQVQRVINFYTIGIPMWWYQWRLSIGAVTSNGSFGWLYPSAVFGYFDTLATPTSDLGVSQWVEEYTRRVGKEYAEQVETEKAMQAWRPALEKLGLVDATDATPTGEPTGEAMEEIEDTVEHMEREEQEKLIATLERTSGAFMTASDTMERVGDKMEQAIKRLKRLRR